MLESAFKSELELIGRQLANELATATPAPHAALGRFWECMNYSLLSPGKRFRPLLALLTARCLDRPLESALPMACAVEFIHAYSLIHDDLPSMDNDDVRRGRPTNHKVYGEALALLAGDALLTHAFAVLARAPSQGTRAAVLQLAEAAGPRGMVGGQVLDVVGESPPAELLLEIHKRKTGALIRVAVEGTAVLLEAPAQAVADLGRFGENLGLAFQLADDLQDFDPMNPEKINFAARFGREEVARQLERANAEALDALAPFGSAAEGLRQMVRFNSERA